MNLLQINTSIFSDGGQSSRLAEDFVRRWIQQHDGTRVTVRNFVTNPIPHLSEATFQAFLTAPEDRDAAQQKAAAFSDALIEELREADVVVLGLPMYNFGIPSQLKAWFDHIARAGITFRYTENGPQGLLTGKKVYVLAARGGMYQGTPTDTQTDFVRNFLNFIGITDVEFIYAEGLNMGEKPRDQALKAARQAIARLAA